MTRISTPYKQVIYKGRLDEHNTNLEPLKSELKVELSSLITKKIVGLGCGSADKLTDSHYREILESLHKADGKKFHKLLNKAEMPAVSRYSWVSNKCATGKVEALKKYLDIDTEFSTVVLEKDFRFGPPQSETRKTEFQKPLFIDNLMQRTGEKLMFYLGAKNDYELTEAMPSKLNSNFNDNLEALTEDLKSLALTQAAIAFSRRNDSEPGGAQGSSHNSIKEIDEIDFQRSAIDWAKLQEQPFIDELMQSLRKELMLYLVKKEDYELTEAMIPNLPLSFKTAMKALAEDLQSLIITQQTNALLSKANKHI